MEHNPISSLTTALKFPSVDKANSDGLLAIGGDLSEARLRLAYKSGIFPWYEAGQPILWWSPNPRFVLYPNNLKVSKSTQQLLRNTTFKVTVNKDFSGIIKNCATAKRNGQQGTWITHEMQNAYINLHQLGHAKSVEVWLEEKLVGGLYGIDLGNGVFSGESMFSLVSNASKLGFISFVQNTNYKLIDCQVYTSHLERLGAVEIAREEFLKYL